MALIYKFTEVTISIKITAILICCLENVLMKTGGNYWKTAAVNVRKTII